MEKEMQEVQQQLIQHMEAITNIAIQELDLNEAAEDMRSQKKTLVKAIKKLSERMNQMRQQAGASQVETANVGSEE